MAAQIAPGTGDAMARKFAYMRPGNEGNPPDKSDSNCNETEQISGKPTRKPLTIRTKGEWHPPGPLAAAIKAEIPGVAAACRTRNNQAPFSVDDKSVYENNIYAESSLFTMFSLSFVEGGTSTAFRDLNSIVITEKMARQFFGAETNVIGKTLKMDDKDNYTVTGVIRKLHYLTNPMDYHLGKGPFLRLEPLYQPLYHNYETL